MVRAILNAALAYKAAVLSFLAAAGFVARIEWLYNKGKKAVNWTTAPQGWDTFASMEIRRKERKLKRELSSEDTKAIIEKWYKRWPWKPSSEPRRW
jgi:hypothetical protein